MNAADPSACVGCFKGWPTGTVDGRAMHTVPREWRDVFDDSLWCNATEALLREAAALRLFQSPEDEARADSDDHERDG